MKRGVAILVGPGEQMLFEILNEKLREALTTNGASDVEIMNVSRLFQVEALISDTPVNQLPIFVFASYGLVTWSGSKIHDTLNAGGEVIVWTREIEYIERMQPLASSNPNLSLYHVAVPAGPDDDFRKGTSELVEEIIDRIKKRA